MISASTPAWAAQLSAHIYPEDESLSFKINCQKTVLIEYPEGGLIRDQLNGQDWQVAGSADSSNPGVQDLMDQMNRNILASGSRASISDLNVSYDIHLKSLDGHTSIEYDVILRGHISDYIIMKDSQRALIDIGWRGLGAHDDVVIDGVEINLPISILKSHLPETYELLAGTEADEILLQPIINTDYILEQPMANWDFRIDRPVVDQGLDGSGRASEYTFSKWALGGFYGLQLSNNVVGTQVTVTLDQEYTVKSKQTVDSAKISVLGYGKLGVLDGAEIIRVSPTMPEWIRTSVSYWVNGGVSDSTFVNCMQYIIENGIIYVPPVPSWQDPVSDIPDRIRTDLSHWANGDVPDSMFISRMQFLIQNNIIHIR